VLTHSIPVTSATYQPGDWELCWASTMLLAIDRIGVIVMWRSVS